MKILQVAEIRTNFSSLLKEVASGHEIGISFGRKKETIAVIVPIEEYKKMKARRLGTLQGKASVEFKGEWTISDEELLNS
ncbi:MAG: type II toxin-antitoxin system Phd/YefM family antitoxin [Breznakiellaceae bacterium]